MNHCSTYELAVAAALTALGKHSGDANLLINEFAPSLDKSRLNSVSSRTFPSTSTSTRPVSKPKLNFAQRLFEILEKPQHSDVITWLPGGKFWIIMDQKRFATEILPAYFKQTQFKSFTRKLHRWKFNRVSKGPYLGAYHHRFFQKDRKHLCSLMSSSKEALDLATVRAVNQEVSISRAADTTTHTKADAAKELKDKLAALEKINRLMMNEHLMNARLRRARINEEYTKLRNNQEMDVSSNTPFRRIVAADNDIFMMLPFSNHPFKQLSYKNTQPSFLGTRSTKHLAPKSTLPSFPCLPINF